MATGPGLFDTLRDLAGNDEAAEVLGCPRGTVAIRLARARDRLRRKLEKRGFGPTAALPALPLTGALPYGLLRSTCQMVQSAATDPTTPDSVINLVDGMGKTMLLEKCRSLMLVLLVVTLLGLAGIGALLAQAPLAPGIVVAWAPVPENQKPPTPAEQRLAERIKDLLDERRRSALIWATQQDEQFIAGRGTLDVLLHATERLAHAELELAATKERRIAIRQDQVERMKKYLDINKARFEAGRASIADVEQTRYFYLDARIELEREKER
jgi:hypothetical protein